MIKEYLRKIVYSLISFINIILPKKKRVVIYGGKNLNDNNEAMFTYLLINTSYSIVCIADNHQNYSLRDNVKFVKNGYFNAAYYILTSTVTIDCSYHTIKVKPTSKQLFLQTWHGSPLKYMKPASGIIDHGELYSLFLYSAEIFKEHMKAFFGVEDNKMFLNGNPRCDYLFDSILCSTAKSIVWLPTYRKSKGRVQTKNDIPILNSFNVLELDKLLEEYNVDLYIKTHPMQSEPFEKTIGSKGFSRIHIIDDQYLMLNQISLYKFLARTDALITDYSSVYYDYLLINRPIGFAIDDFDEYGSNTGYAFENPLNYMPGEIIKSFDDLVRFITNVKRNVDQFESERERVNKIVNFYRDNRNCERCATIIANYLL